MPLHHVYSVPRSAEWRYKDYTKELLVVRCYNTYEEINTLAEVLMPVTFWKRQIALHHFIFKILCDRDVTQGFFVCWEPERYSYGQASGVFQGWKVIGTSSDLDQGSLPVLVASTGTWRTN